MVRQRDQSFFLSNKIMRESCIFLKTFLSTRTTPGNFIRTYQNLSRRKRFNVQFQSNRFDFSVKSLNILLRINSHRVPLTLQCELNRNERKLFYFKTRNINAHVCTCVCRPINTTRGRQTRAIKLATIVQHLLTTWRDVGVGWKL